MLTRFRFRRDFRFMSRYLSDKPLDDVGKAPDAKQSPQNASKKNDVDNMEKIQELIKSMSLETKLSESEYRTKFVTAPDPRRRRKQADDEIERKTEKIEESITKAASNIAEAIGGDVKQTESELLHRVLGKINQTSTQLSDLLIGMKVDRSQETDSLVPETRGQQVKRLVQQRDTRESRDTLKTRYSERKPRTHQRERDNVVDRQYLMVDVFGGQPLNIFSGKGVNYGTKLDVWEKLQKRETTLAISQPPANYFQKMILWTEQGKVWKFPINNEQGLEEEQNVHFSEHIFLDSYLEGWCPAKGPIRHFMELVCVGLSKNPFYTSQEKKDHIMWYKEYFVSKKDLLMQVGAWDNESQTSSETSV